MIGESPRTLKFSYMILQIRKITGPGMLNKRSIYIYIPISEFCILHCSNLT
jgi:hypothetical protein